MAGKVRTVVHLPQEQVDDLKLIAAHRGDSVSSLVRDALRLYLADVGKYMPYLLVPLQPRRDHEQA